MYRSVSPVAVVRVYLALSAVPGANRIAISPHRLLDLTYKVKILLI